MSSSYRARLRRQLRKYAKKQLVVLPIRPPSNDGTQTGKAPLTQHGHKDALLGRRAVQNLFASHPDANVAVATGPRSNLIVLDVDGPKGRKTLAELEKMYGKLPET
jgi:putative DNA primase/helicase